MTTELTPEELDALAEEVATRVKEFMGIHAKERVLQILTESAPTIFTNDSIEQIAIKYEMIFKGEDLRTLLKAVRSGRIKPLSIPSAPDEWYGPDEVL